MPPTGWNIVACMSGASSNRRPPQNSASSRALIASGGRSCSRTGAGKLRRSGTRRTGIGVIALQVSVDLEKTEHALMVFGRELFIERVLIDALSEQLGDVPSGIVDGLALLDGLAAEGAVVHQQRTPRAVNLHFERNAELFAIAQDRFVNGR